MLHLYYANQLTNHKDLLVSILTRDPNPDPFATETILVQSIGMAQWLQLQIAEHTGISGNLKFPYPTRFLWEQYRLLLTDLPKENLFERSAVVWRLMRLIPQHLHLPEFAPLAFYLNSADQLRLYQLAAKVADLFDQYLVYRAHWLTHWENGTSGKILAEICQSPTFRQGHLSEVEQSIAWQGMLWNALVAEIKADSDAAVFNTSHRAYLQKRYFERLDKLSESDKRKLPPRIFVFGISALPLAQLEVLKKLSEHCQIHLFFTNPSEVFWGDQREDRLLEKLALNQDIDEHELQSLLEHQGNPLLATWGKQGKEFLNLVLEQDPDNIVPYYTAIEGDNLPLLQQVKRAILYYEHQTAYQWQEGDRSIQLHACHSKMREVEVLHNQLLNLFEQQPDLSPKDIIVMSADIDSYAPYIEAVFARYEYRDSRYIPFTLSDQKISYIDSIISSFLSLLKLNEARFSVDELLDLFNVQAIRAYYGLSESSLETLREWVESSGIRAGLQQDNQTWQNYNSWENGLNRLLLGSCLKVENGVWQSLVAFDESYGLSAELVGILAKFIDNLTAWQQMSQQPHTIMQWQTALHRLINDFYLDDSDSTDSLILLHNTIDQIAEQITATHFDQNLVIEVLATLFEQQLSEQRSNLHFLVGKVNFCTLLPMRAIPFKVVCLLGMNEGDFPRQQPQNSFDLMQYARQKGDRARRDDDRYLFLEALLSAQNVFYISYIGQSLTDNQTKLPSILVAQLLDYLGKSAEQLITRHPMTPFSRHNFYGEHFSYDKEWLQAVEKQVENAPFIRRLVREEGKIPTEIFLDDLIDYVQDPYRFFFHHQLGVKFEQYEEEIDESEVFKLEGLERYHFFKELLGVEQVDLADYFEIAKLKGNLPACHFGTLAIQELVSTILPFKEALSPYLTQPSEAVEAEILLTMDEYAITLKGEGLHAFGQEVVEWRVGRLRDQDLIRAWLLFLVLQAQDTPLDLLFYFRQGQQAKAVRFAPISQAAAKTQLTCYIRDYLRSFSELTWVINEKIGDYLGVAEFDPNQVQQWLDDSSNVYIELILSQPNESDLQQMYERTLAWFGTMQAHKKII